MIMNRIWTNYIQGVGVGSVLIMVLVAGCAGPKPTEKAETAMPTVTQTQTTAAVAPDSAVKVVDISTQELVGKTRITIEGSAELTYTAFKLNDPLRLVLDLPNVDTSQVSEITPDELSPIRRITPFQFVEDETVNSRVEVALSRLVPYQVFSDANKLFIDLETPTTQTAQAAEAPSAEPPSALPPGFEELPPAKPETQPIQIESTPPEAPPVSPEAPTIEITRPPDSVGEVQPLPGTITELAVVKNLEVTEAKNATQITIYADKTPEFDVKRSDEPARLIMDLKQSDLLPAAEKVFTPDALETFVKNVRIFQLRRTPGGTDNVVRVMVELMQPTKHEVITEPGKLVLKVEHSRMMAEPPDLEDEEELKVPLTTGIEEALQEQEEVAEEEASVSETPTIRAPSTGEESEYKGQLISMYFQEADILEVLGVIAEVSGLNQLIDPQVQGTVSVRFENVPWDQALDLILKTNDLQMELEDNIMRIAPASVFQAERQQRLQEQRDLIEARQVEQELEPLVTKLITVNFAEPGGIVSIIEQYFEGTNAQRDQEERRGTITVDSRTKTLIIQDTAANIKKIEEIVATLDRRTPQVMIEARVVALNTGFRRELGINWAGSFSADPAHGNPTGYRFPYTINSVDQFGINFPSVTDPVGTTGMLRFGSIDDVLTIFARIDAAEEEYRAKTLGQPKIFTQDNKPASVSAGQTRQVAGTSTINPDGTVTTTTKEVSATLTLNVTPRISGDGYVTMTVNVSNGSFTSPTGGNVNQQNVNSEITVRDGETVVIGGIFTTTEFKNLRAVPYLHKIPLLGRLFKSTLPNSQAQEELLVFMTPRILDRSVLQSGDASADVSLSY